MTAGSNLLEGDVEDSFVVVGIPHVLVVGVVEDFVDLKEQTENDFVQKQKSVCDENQEGERNGDEGKVNVDLVWGDSNGGKQNRAGATACDVVMNSVACDREGIENEDETVVVDANWPVE